ncbi:hypothetical protein CSV72_04055 [Sporosarcina sp. P20a]|uniref:hypothetical protein n=1 Tax=Sporosarcina sp. P20a TaxID=2048256 RepID=UPI000C167931|nr:hypothetical protein [Sporosarcina sp. P20a]PIC87159.1 hypothetical protein CSV72_04055 [Sporosarcina sp. P20a]
MKRQTWGIIALTALTLLLIYDFFPKLISFINIPKSILIVLILVIALIGLFMNRPQKENVPRFNPLWQIILLAYFIALIMIFTLMGGVSQVGLSLTNPFLWIMFFISIIASVKR